MFAVVNIEENIGKTVGKRKLRDPLAVPKGDREAKRNWQKAGFFPHIKRGVYKFTTFEEADAWWMKMMTTPRS